MLWVTEWKEPYRYLTQLFRYVIVGISSNGVGYLLYLLVTSLGVGPKITMSCLYFTGAVIGFFANRHITFSHQGRITSSLARYSIVHVVGYVLNFMLLFLFVDELGFPHQSVQAVAIFIVALFLFFMFKFFVFPYCVKSRGLTS
jgi:putative flippase GtrA